MTTPFLRSLQPVDMRTRHSKVAHHYLAVKGYRDVRALGMIANGPGCWYYYYDLPDGLLELEVCHDPDADYWSKKVVGFVTDSDRVADYLGR